MGCALVPWKQRENLTVGGHLASPFLSSRGCPRIPGVAWVYVARAVRSARSGDPSLARTERKGKEWCTYSCACKRDYVSSLANPFSASYGTKELGTVASSLALRIAYSLRVAARRKSRVGFHGFDHAFSAGLVFPLRGNGTACVDRTFRAYTQRQS